MDPLHAVYLTVGLFVITFFNPGANLFVVVQTSPLPVDAQEC